MKKILLYAVLIIAVVFYIAQTSFAEIGSFNTDGNLFSDRQIQENIFESSQGEEIKTVAVKANDKLYSRGSGLYVGEKKKKEISDTLPMYISDGDAIKMLAGTETLITNEFERIDSYEGLILKNGTAFNDDMQRADWNEYLLVRFPSGLYVNVQEIEVKTFLHTRQIPLNSVCYFTPEYIRYYYYDNGTFRSGAITDVDYESVIKIGSTELSYYDFLLNLGEIKVESDKIQNNDKTTQIDEPEDTTNTSPKHDKKDGKKSDDNQVTDGTGQGENPSQDIQKPQQPQKPAQPETPEKPAPVAPTKPADASRPSTDVPETPATPSKPTDEGLVVKYPDWKKPSVTSKSLTPGIYIVKNEVSVDDPAGVIIGGLTYEVYRNEGEDKGKLYKRSTVSTGSLKGSDTSYTSIVSGLEPEYNYTIKGYFKYKDKYGRVVSETVVFLETTPFKTKEMSELGALKINRIDYSDAKYYPTSISVPSLSFSSESDSEAIGTLSRMALIFTDPDGNKTTVLLSSANLEKIKSGQAVTLSSGNVLKPGTEYDIKIKCYDRFANELTVENDTTNSRTCKKLPKCSIEVDTSKIGAAIITPTVGKDSDIECKNLRIKIVDSKGNTVKINGQETKSVKSGEKTIVDSLEQNKTYTVLLLCDCDIADGKGMQEKTLATKVFNTSEISALGALYIEATNVTSQIPDADTSSRAVIKLSIKNTTNEDLKPFVSIMTVTLTCGEDVISYTLTDEELEKIKNGESILLDTDKIAPGGLKSNSTYSAKYKAQYVNGDEKIDLKVSGGVSKIKTSRRSVEIEMKNVQGYAGFITADIRVSDLDGVVNRTVNDDEDNKNTSIILQVRKPKGTSSVIVAAFRIDVNSSEYYQLRMYKDKNLSSDGNSYDIEGDTKYIFRFIAEEANTDSGLRSNYLLLETEVKTQMGATGKVYLKALTPKSSSTYNAEMLAEISDPDEWLSTKTFYADIYRFNGGKVSLIETRELSYTGTGTNGNPIAFSFDAEKSKYKTDSYKVQIYIKLNEELLIPLSSTQFTTEEQIYTISNYQELLAVKASKNKYVVIADIYADTGDQNYQKDYRQGNVFGAVYNAKIDFQGFTFEYRSRKTFITTASAKSEISNMVFKNHVYSNDKNDAGLLIYTNNGILRNIKIEFSQGDGLTNGDKNGWGYHLDETGELVPWEYPKFNGCFVSYNNGLIENFAVEMKTPFTTAGQGSILVRQNQGTVRNGYVYGDNPDENHMGQIYVHDQGKKVNNNGNMSGVVAWNTGGAVVENVFAMVNISTSNSTYKEHGIIVGKNQGNVRNCYSVGGVLYEGKTIEAQGPAVGTNTAVCKNIYYISQYSYNNKHNAYCSVLALKSESWQEGILNQNSRGVKGFNVSDPVSANCYPQVIYTSEVMPAQPYIPLPDEAARGTVDLLFSDTYTPDASNKYNEILKEYVEGNEAWDKPDENNKTCHTQVLMLQFSDKSARDIYSVDIDGLDSEVIRSYKDGSGVTTVYLKVYNPTKCLSKYQVRSVTFKNYDDSPGSRYNLTNRYANISYFWRIENTAGNTDSWEKIAKKPDENFIVKNDLDFEGKTIDKVMVNATYSGEFNGNEKTIKNIAYKKNLYGAGVTSQAGLFKIINGAEVYDLTLSDVNIEAGGRSGLLAGEISNAVLKGIYANKSYVSGGIAVGGIGGKISNSTLSECGVRNIKLYNTCVSTDGKYHTGGFAGGVEGSILTRCFAQGVYVESMFISNNASAAGGLIGAVSGANAALNGCYATGTVNANADFVGGLVGYLSATSADIGNLYSNVDVVSFNGDAGGMFGKSTIAFDDEITGLVFGNVSSGILMDEQDERRDTFSLVCADGSVSAGVYKQARVILSADESSKKGAGTEFSYDDLTAGTLTTYLTTDYYDCTGCENGTLPRLADASGNVLPGQDDEILIGGEDGGEGIHLGAVSTSGSGSSWNADFTISHSQGIRIEKIYTDYTFADESVGLESGEGVDTFTRHQALSARHELIRGETTTSVAIRNASPASCYDIYRITAIQYTKEGKTFLARVGQPLSITQQFHEIGSIDDWQRKVENSYCENFKLTGDVDFSGKRLIAYDESYANKLILRLVGTKGSASDYDITSADDEAELPYYIIKSAELNTSMNFLKTDFGWMYCKSVGLIRAVIGECKNVAFEGINIKGKDYHTGIIGSGTGFMQGVIFKDCTVSGSYQSGMVGLFRGSMKNISLLNCRFSGSGSTDQGTLAGCLKNGANNVVSDIKADNCTVIGKSNTIGGIFGYMTNGDIAPMKKAEMKISNVKVTDSTIQAGNAYSGAVIGYANVYGLLKNAEISNCRITGKANAGGIIGYTFMNIQKSTVSDCEITGTIDSGGIAGFVRSTSYTDENTIKDSIIKGIDRIGGIAGQSDRDVNGNTVLRCTIQGSGTGVGGAVGQGAAKRAKVKDCLIVGNSTVGGIVGQHDTNSIVIKIGTGINDYNGLVDNCKIYGGQKVGGATGNQAAGGSGAMVVNSEIRGWSIVGGYAGSLGNGSIQHGYVGNCFISALTSEIASIYNITAGSSDNRYQFGGITGWQGYQTNTNITYSLVEGCIVGDPKANRVGGAVGNGRIVQNSIGLISKNTIVVGNSDVGGLFGGADGGGAVFLLKDSYSNSMVWANDNAGGIIGVLSVGSYTDSNNKTQYYKIPGTQTAYFTGQIYSSGRAAAYAAVVDGSDENEVLINGVTLAPGKIQAVTYAPVIAGTTGGTGQTYGWNGLTKSKKNLYIPLFGDTVLTNGVSETKMSALLSTGAYKAYVSDMKTVADNYSKGIAGDAFIFTYADTNELAQKVYSSGLFTGRASSSFANGNGYKVAGQAVTLMPLLKGEGGVIFDPNNPLSKTFNFDEVSGNVSVTGSQGVSVPGTAAYDAEIAKMQKMYDDFIKGNGANTLCPIDFTTFTSEEADTSSCMQVYSADVDKVSVELPGEFFKQTLGKAVLTVIKDGESEPLFTEDMTQDRRVVTFTSNYRDKLTLRLEYADIYGAPQAEELTIEEKGLSLRAMLYGGEGYYQTEEGIFRASDQECVLSGSFVNISRGKALDAEGSIWNLSNNASEGEAVTTGKVVDDNPLYEFKYDGKQIRTYGTFSAIGEESDAVNSDDIRFYEKNGNLIAVKNSVNAVSDGIFAYYEGEDSYVAVLTESGKLLSLGSVDIPGRLNDFKNASIAEVTSNLSSGGTLLIATYLDGSILGYDIKTGELIFRTEAVTTPSLGEYLQNAFSQLFNFRSKSLSTASRQTEELIALMEDSDMSLEEVLQLSSQEILEDKGSVSEGSDSEGSDSENGEGNTDANDENNAPGEESDRSGGGNLPESAENSPLPSQAAETKPIIAASGAMQPVYSQTSQGRNQYISVYDGEKDSFDIYSTSALLTEPEKTVAETEKIIDKSSLRAMYKKLADHSEDTNRRGIALYIVIICMIAIGMTAILAARRKEHK